ncbi:MAG: MAPEG family protein [gamma proteobacterium symbiont of Taylorina sp.]|nr:MAPEG family protein [gamma proteobacterium symbiont of Taylorina sp.]
MTTELYWLVLSILLTSLLWVPYILNRLFEQGILTALWDPDGETATLVPWAKRLMSAHVNAVENLVVFAPLVIIAHILGINTEMTEFACLVYFFSRLAHAVLFTIRTPVLRIVTFFGGFFAQMAMVLAILKTIS